VQGIHNIGSKVVSEGRRKGRVLRKKRRMLMRRFPLPYNKPKSCETKEGEKGGERRNKKRERKGGRGGGGANVIVLGFQIIPILCCSSITKGGRNKRRDASA